MYIVNQQTLEHKQMYTLNNISDKYSNIQWSKQQTSTGNHDNYSYMSQTSTLQEQQQYTHTYTNCFGQ